MRTSQSDSASPKKFSRFLHPYLTTRNPVPYNTNFGSHRNILLANPGQAKVIKLHG